MTYTIPRRSNRIPRNAGARLLLIAAAVTWLPPAPTHAVCNDLRGDLNCDGVIDSNDTAPFVLALIDPTTYALSFPGCPTELADLNGDSTSDGADVLGFVNLLLSGAQPAPRITYLSQVREMDGQVTASDGEGNNASDSDFSSAPDFEPFLDTIDLVVDSPTSQGTAFTFQSSSLCDGSITAESETAVTATVNLQGSASGYALNTLSATFDLGDESIRLVGDIRALGVDSRADLSLTGPLGNVFSISAEEGVEPFDFSTELDAGTYTLFAETECDVSSGFGFQGRSAGFSFEFTVLGAPPPAAIGACCLGSGSNCAMATEAECANVLGGLYVGPETDCATTFCGLPVTITQVDLFDEVSDNCPGTQVAADILGTGFQEDVTVKFIKPGAPDIVAYQVGFVNDMTLFNVRFHVDGFPPGTWQLEVVNPDNGFAIATETLTLTACP